MVTLRVELGGYRGSTCIMMYTFVIQKEKQHPARDKAALGWASCYGLGILLWARHPAMGKASEIQIDNTGLPRLP